MSVTKREFESLKEQKITSIIDILTNERGIKFEDAIDKIYSSSFFLKLSDVKTGLFYQSPRYLLSYFDGV